ncbi:hypothetical protein BMG03_01085 [Thioclava nitratireducens]|uniref:Uncharacterized protein n=1 Tax=Thioclava nitratireducens TaxID=1915078 RepID=A0ABN4X3K4_9RHOB|nr:hypothetical protein [Thioclava nitratireducens]AQS46550.1 hypothetical protein BMG03_01085 [Thioclava nitratireducens]
MTLTVPKAGVVAGRSATPTISQPDIGGAVAGLGDTMMKVGTEIAREQRQRQYSEARIEMMKGLNDLRLEFDQVGDPDVIDREFPARAKELKAQIVGKLDPHIQEDASLLFDELEVPHSAAIGRQAIGLRRSVSMAQLARTTQTTVETAGTADPATQATYVDMLDEHLNDLVANGTITPEDAQLRRQKAMAEMRTTRATKLLSTDPQALIDGIDQGEFSGMDPSQMQGYRARASAQLAADAKAAQVEADRAQKEALSQATSFLKDGATVFGKGRAWTGADQADQLLKDPLVAATPEAREYIGAQKLFELMPEFSKLPIAEKEKALAEQRKKPISEGFEADVAEAMQKSVDADRKGFADDRFAYAAKIGLNPAPPLPDPTTASAEELSAAITKRAQYSASLTQMGYVNDFKLFSPEEAAVWKEKAGLDAPPAARAKLAMSLAGSLGNDTWRVTKEIGAGPVFGYVGGLLAHGGTESLAREIFSGQRALKDKDVQMPPVAERRQTFFKDLTGLFDDGTRAGSRDETKVRNEVLDAADALYAYRGRGDPNAMDGTVSESDYLQAVHEVMGGSGEYDSSSARGGIQEIRGHVTILPPTVSGGDVEGAIAWVHNAARTNFNEKLWRKISINGALPQVGGESLSAPGNQATWNNTYLRAVGGSTFNLMVHNPATGREEYVYGDDGKPYTFDIKPLLTETEGLR